MLFGIDMQCDLVLDRDGAAELCSYKIMKTCRVSYITEEHYTG